MKKLFEKIRLLFGGYGDDGYNRKGFDREGYDREGYNRRGFNKKRKHKVTGGWFDTDGFDSNGFDEDGEHMDYAYLKGNRESLLQDGIVQVDLHGMSVRAAAYYLEDLLDYDLSDDVYRLVIIHGYSHGSILKSMVQSFEHDRICEIDCDTRNEGMTIFELYLPGRN